MAAVGQPLTFHLKALLFSDSVRTIDPNSILVDVREAEDYTREHIPNAINIPLGAFIAGKRGPEENGIKAGDLDRPITIYCGSGFRSGLAVEHLRKEGFRDLRNLGGYQAYKNSQK
eukprot:TRINITY_DN754_c0_g1_i1.p1 TRINITY_DN754_c0_g1~~TRINITY_DN754_c0_g1_i1.p1  ORF type:complete len:116 (-),score=25.43 TRINITY_DN754_c0_g1_i1:75-422(-)